ncbi:MAG TPA: tetratricopeptide repeat protein [Candidatus Angelobacter sp.]|nr:tetratricopeptide repeat protein [Candidatus Angelobacter sp.]
MVFIICLVVALSFLGAAFVLRIVSSKAQIVVSPVEILAVSSDQKSNSQNTKALADLVVDKLHSILEQASSFSGNMYSSKKSFAQIPGMPHIPVETSYGIEIKGVSVDQLMATWNHIRYHEFQVSGSLILGTGGDQTLILRYITEDQANSFSAHFMLNNPGALEKAISSLTLDLIKDLNPEAAARYLFVTALACTGTQEACWEPAVQFCWAWTKKAPTSAHAFDYLGSALSHTEHPGDALPFLDRSLQLDSGLYSALNTKGVILMNQGNYPDAELAFTASLDIRKTPNPWVNLGITAIRQKHYAEAEVYYRKALAKDKKDIGAYLNLGHVLLHLSKNSEAVEAYRQARYLSPGSYPALWGLALSLASAGKPTEALQECEKAAHLYLDVTDREMIEGIVFLQTRQTDLAIERFASAVKHTNSTNHPNSTEASYYLAMAYAQKGYLELASKQLQTTLDPSKNQPELHNLLAKVLLAQGDLQGSKSESDEMARIAPWFKNDSLDELLPIFTTGAGNQDVRAFQSDRGLRSNAGDLVSTDVSKSH